MNPNSKSHSNVALHEAGHVVAHFIFKKEIPEGFEYATIIPDEEKGSLGMVKSKPATGKNPGYFDFLHSGQDNFENAGLTQRELEANLCLSLAGEAAAYIESDERDDSGSGRKLFSGDHEACCRLLESIFPMGEDTQSPENLAIYHYTEALFWRMVCLLKQPGWWEKVEAIAIELEVKKKLTEDQCRRIAFPNLSN